MGDVTQQPSADASSTNEEGHSLLPKDRLKRFFLAVPVLSLLVGGALLTTEVTVIVLVLVAPTTVGISEELALTRAQRGVLGGVSIIMLIEAIIFGVIDIGTTQYILQYMDTYNCTMCTVHVYVYIQYASKKFPKWFRSVSFSVHYRSVPFPFRFRSILALHSVSFITRDPPTAKR